MKKRSSGGRPALPADEKRSLLMVFRVRLDEARRLRAAARESEMRIGTWLRTVAIAAAAKRLRGDGRTREG